MQRTSLSRSPEALRRCALKVGRDSMPPLLCKLSRLPPSPSWPEAARPPSRPEASSASSPSAPRPSSSTCMWRRCTIIGCKCIAQPVHAFLRMQEPLCNCCPSGKGVNRRRASMRCTGMPSGCPDMQFCPKQGARSATNEVSAPGRWGGGAGQRPRGRRRAAQHPKSPP